MLMMIGAVMKITAVFWRLGDNGGHPPCPPSIQLAYHPSIHPSGLHTVGLSRAFPGVPSCLHAGRRSELQVCGLVTDCQQTVRSIHARFFSGSPARAAACALLKEQNKLKLQCFP